MISSNINENLKLCHVVIFTAEVKSSAAAVLTLGTKNEGSE